MKNHDNSIFNQNSLCETFLLYQNSAQLHNDCLDYLSTVENHLSMSFSRAFQEAAMFVSKTYPTINVSGLITEEQMKVFYDKLIEVEAENRQVEFVVFLQSQGLLTLNQAGYYISIINTILKNQNEKPVVITSALLGLQNALLLRTDVNPNELSVMYATSTGAIASFGYWRASLRDEDSPWNPVTVERALSLPGWLKRRLRDLGGFIVGGIAGGIIAGPAGAVAGGTLVGGACSGADGN